MPRRRSDDEDFDDTPRRRRRAAPKSKVPLYVGLGVAVAAVLVAVIVIVVVSRGGRGLEREEVTEDGVRIVTQRSPDGSVTAKQYLPPADGRPYGMRHDQVGLRVDRTALTEGWALMQGRWERKDEDGQRHVAEFRPDHTATVTLRFAEGLKTAEYTLRSVTDDTGLVPSIKTYKRHYTVDLRPAGKKDETISFMCGIRPDGSLWAGHSGLDEYKRVR
ncbi:MAG TPA: hypothetical protein VD866_19295 [Urbifossiella sp.]|nr:hypothetical protein [Urbifossiella sp.]